MSGAGTGINGKPDEKVAPKGEVHSTPEK